MGNHQSKPQNRLSKPKTNTNSPSLPPKTDSPVLSTPPCADLSTRGRQHIKDSLLSSVNTEPLEVSWPAKENDKDEKTTQLPNRTLPASSRTNSRANSRSNSVSRFGSRHGSMTKIAGFAESKQSLNVNTTVDLEAAIRLLQEVKKNASPEDLAALQEVLESVENDTVPNSEQNLSRNTSLVNRSSSSLTRRRSLIQTPGVATRLTSVEGRRRTWNSWRTPQLQPEEEAKWRTAYKTPSPIARMSVANSVSDSRSMPTARPQTPADLDYGHIGSRRMGPLMVTNGAASPVASTSISDRTSRDATREDYFSATDADSDALMMKSTRRRDFSTSQSTVRPNQAVSSVQTDSHVECDLADLCGEPWKIQTSTAAPASFTPSADAFAQSYLLDASVEQEYRQLKPTFGASPYSNEEASNDAQAPVYELDASLETTILELAATDAVLPIQQSHETKPSYRPPPTTYDSGYSSGGSFRARRRTDRGDQLSTPTTSRNSKNPDSPGRTMPKSILSRFSAHTTDLEQRRMSRNQQRPRSLVLPVAPARYAASDATPSPITPQSIVSRASFDSTSSKTPNRLQRRCTSQAESPVVQSCQSIPEGVIPNVPDNVRAKFVRRLSNTPGMECLTNTYQTKDDVNASQPAVNASFDVTDPASQYIGLEPDRASSPAISNPRRRSRSLFRRKSSMSDMKAETPALSIVDLGTIAASLGTSPYDAAMTGLRRQSVTSPTHPHQLGNALPRAKSMVRMNSDTATEFARMHSKDHMAVVPGMPSQLQQSQQQQQQQQRRKSYHDSIDVGEAKALKRRSHSFVGEIPPVPLVDRSKHGGPQYAAMPRHDSNSQKVFTSSPTVIAKPRERRQLVTQSFGGNAYRSQALPPQSLDWEFHANTWKLRRKSISEGLRMDHRLGS